MIVMDYNPENQRSKWKEKHFLRAKFQLIYVDELMGLGKKNHHSAATTVMVSGKNPPSLIKLMGKTMKGNWVFHRLQVSSHKIITTKEKRVTF